MALNPDKSGLAWIRDLTGGLNDTDAPQDLADNQCSIAQNVEWVTTKFAQRRQGGTNDIHATEPWGSQKSLMSLMRHTPSADETAAELWGVDESATPIMARLAGSNQFSAVTVTDAWITGDQLLLMNAVSLNGKLFIAGRTSQNRLHVWDGTSLRRTGFTTPAAATVANTGAGAYAATIRHYKVQWIDSATPRRRSELSASVSFTPSGAGTAARVTRPSAPGEGETDWVLFGSPDGVNYYALASAAIATTTIDDSVNPVNYATATPTAAGFPTQADYFTAAISAKYLLADQDRLILLGSWETAGMSSAVMYTPVIGTTPLVYSVADDERVPSRNRFDVDRQHGGGITGGALWNSSLWVFKLSQIHEFIRTGDDAQPYRPGWKTKTTGALSHKGIVEGEDENGASALYFLSQRGPYRLSQAGLEYLGRDIETTWDTVNVSSSIPPFGVWHRKKRQVQWWVITGAASTPNKKLVFHVRHGRRDDQGNIRGGWAVHTDGAADALCAVMFANTLGATMSIDLKPYVGQKWVASLPDGPCIKYDADGTYTDRGGNATTYIARVKSGAFPPAGIGMRGSVTQPYVLGTTANRELAIDLIRDFNAETRSGEVTLPAPGSNSLTRALVKVEDDVAAQDAMYVELVIDDDTSPASSGAWTIDAVGLRLGREAQI